MLDMLQGVVDPLQARVLVFLIVVNLGTGTLAAIVTRRFELNRLKDFWKRVLTVLGAYLVVAVTAGELADFTALRAIMWLALIGHLLTQILTNLVDMGLPIPQAALKWLERRGKDAVPR